MSPRMLFPEPETTLAATTVAEDEGRIALRKIARPRASQYDLQNLNHLRAGSMTYAEIGLPATESTVILRHLGHS